MRTRQQVVDFVAAHLRKQGRRAVAYARRSGRESTHCLYLDEDTGRTCAVGCQIDRDEYDSGFEDLEVGDVLEAVGLAEYGSLQIALQRLHDMADNWNLAEAAFIGENNLRELCRLHELTYPAPVKPVVNPVKDREALAAQHRERTAYADRHKW